MKLIKLIITDVLTSLYQQFWFSVLLAVLALFFYLYAYKPVACGKGFKAVCSAWWKEFKTSSYFRRLFFLTFYSAMILFRTLLNRNMWCNPLSDVMGGWWIWKYNSNTHKMVITAECFENLALFIPFTILLFCTIKEKLLNIVTFRKVLWISIKITFLISLSIELLQLFLRLGTFQLSDLFYNTLGGLIGGIMYFIGCRIKTS